MVVIARSQRPVVVEARGAAVGAVVDTLTVVVVVGVGTHAMAGRRSDGSTAMTCQTL